jgi:DNA-binding transcriptional regulator YdaS (Cro superfamily)
MGVNKWLIKALAVGFAGSQAALAPKIPMTEMQFSQIVTGRRRATAKEKTRIAELLNVPATVLFSEEKDEASEEKK